MPDRRTTGAVETGVPRVYFFWDEHSVPRSPLLHIHREYREGLRVEEAAFGVGYASASQFSREFKRYFNVPPSEAETLPYAESG